MGEAELTEFRSHPFPHTGPIKVELCYAGPKFEGKVDL